jgi:hypothetical protein
MEGGYAKISAQSPVSVWKAPQNKDSGVGSFTTVYHHVRLDGANGSQLYLSPGIDAELRDGTIATYLATVTQAGQATALLVSSSDRTNVRTVAPSEIAALVRPLQAPDVDWIGAATKEEGDRRATAHASGELWSPLRFLVKIPWILFDLSLFRRTRPQGIKRGRGRVNTSRTSQPEPW